VGGWWGGGACLESCICSWSCSGLPRGRRCIGTKSALPKAVTVRLLRQRQ
jgi:hypothetical protein